MNPIGQQRIRTQARGFAAATVLFAIALFVLVGAATTTIARGNAKAKMFHEIKEQMISQAELTLSMLLLCRTLYPLGDNLTTFHVQYPAASTGTPLDSVVCPGQSTSIWSGDSRAIAPRPLPGFSQFIYYNDATSVRIETTATNPDPYYTDLMNAVVRKIGPAQATVAADKLTILLVN